MTLKRKYHFSLYKALFKLSSENVEIVTVPRYRELNFFYKNGSETMNRMKNDEGLYFGWQLHAIKYLLLLIFLCLLTTHYIIKNSFLSFKVRANFLKVVGGAGLRTLFALGLFSIQTLFTFRVRLVCGQNLHSYPNRPHCLIINIWMMLSLLLLYS